MADQHFYDQIRELQAALERQRQITAAEKRRADALEASRAVIMRAAIVGRPLAPIEAPIARAAPVRDTFTTPVIAPSRRRIDIKKLL